MRVAEDVRRHSRQASRLRHALESAADTSMSRQPPAGLIGEDGRSDRRATTGEEVTPHDGNRVAVER